ncbi:MAG: tRNA guanosine(34) transglycosylase Tgt [Chloroflexi bacterium]|nr:tRNA guanosine(34) transglycosylase Tgt [Chloroflexota bacterium]
MPGASGKGYSLSFGFRLVETAPGTAARAGVLNTSHGEIMTPVFMPVGTQATVKSLAPSDLAAMGAQIVLANAYHLFLRPGSSVVRDLGGLHRFMAWHHPILTDSGGFQVFSLGHLRRIGDDGVVFRSHIDGSEHLFSPERVVAIQEELGADIIMAFDECTAYPSDHQYNRLALDRTHRWADRCLAAHTRSDQALFGIVQGGMFPDLRRECAQGLVSLNFPGYAVGGLSIGEPKETTFEMLEATMPLLPADRPRYLMGVGSPEDLFESVARGADMFDSVLPTRVARNGALFTRDGRKNIRNASFKRLDQPFDGSCDCYTCKTFSAAYVHHLFRAEELLGYRLASIHNLRFLIKLMERMRRAILDGSFLSLKRQFMARYRPTDQEVRLAQKQKWVESQHAKG